VTKLERLARSRPCRGCGKAFHAPGPPAGEEDWSRLSAAEQDELARLIAAGSTPACARCGRSGYELTRMTDDQLDRTLHLLRALYGRQWPADPCTPVVSRRVSG
jgi:hypothetical protein